MYIPSYDDLTPSIPDVAPGEVFASVVRVLPPSPPVAHAARGIPEAQLAAAALFACLRSSSDPDFLIAVAGEFSPRIERHGAACVVLDVAGLGGLIGSPIDIGTELDRAVAARGAIRVAIAPTQTAAMLLSLAHPAVTVVTGNVEAALAPISIRCLEHLAAEADGARVDTTAHSRKATSIFDVLRRWGLRTIGEFAALPADDLSARLGQAGVALQQLARGIDRRPLIADPCVPRFVQSMELEWPIEALEPLSFVFARLLDPLSSALERADRGAAAIRLDLRLTDRTVHTRSLLLPAPMRDARVLRTLLLLDLESHPPNGAIDVVTIEIDPAPARVIQYSLLQRALPSAETIATLMARLGALVGDTRCGSPALLDSHRPDGFELRRFAPSDSGARPAADAMQQRTIPPSVATSDVYHTRHALEPCVRRFRPPIAVRVTLERGRPVHLAIDRRGMPGGVVEQSAGPWRASGAWWDRSTGWNRDEWDVALSDGSVCRLFRERDTGRWFLDGVLD